MSIDLKIACGLRFESLILKSNIAQNNKKVCDLRLKFSQ